MADRDRVNPLALAVLSCLKEHPMHPYEVAQTLRSRAQHESIRLNYGSLYGVVDGLDQRGLIAVRETTREGRRPARTVYEITADGEGELVAWLSDLLSAPMKEYPQFQAALSLVAALPPDDALRLLRQRVEALDDLITATEECLPVDVPPLFLIEADYEMTMRQAEAAWVRDLITMIESGRLDGVEGWREFHRTTTNPPQPEETTP
jgi:DNA-binding PadR family transcriptional regulator